MEDHRKLYRLHELSDYKVASDYPDVRGWKIVDADNRKIGEVDDLLINKAEERVVYLDIEVDKKLIEDKDQPLIESKHTDAEDHLVVPIGAVSIDADHKSVVCNDIDYSTFRRARRLRKGQDIKRDYETELIRVYYPDDNRDNLRDNTDDEYNRFYDRRQFQRRD